MIPEFDSSGLLPPGLHNASFGEIRAVLGFTKRRKRLIDGLERFVRVWNESGFLEYCVIDGSFATSKPEPGDIDALLIPKPESLYSRGFSYLAMTHSYDREFTKSEFDCEAFFTTGEGDLEEWMDFFATDRRGRRRGLIKLEFPIW